MEATECLIMGAKMGVLSAATEVLWPIVLLLWAIREVLEIHEKLRPK